MIAGHAATPDRTRSRAGHVTPPGLADVPAEPFAAVLPDGIGPYLPGENFVVAAAWIPRAERRLLLAVYAYARLVDQLGDSPSAEAGALLDSLEDEVCGRPPGARSGIVDPLLSAGLSGEWLLDLIAANRLDRQPHRCGTFDDLLGYCRLSAVPVGRLVLEVMGESRAAALRPADAITSGLQIVEHLQDVGEDMLRDRVYLPQDDLAAAGVQAPDLRAGTVTPGLREVVRLEAGRARALLVEGGALVRLLRGWRRLAVAGYVAGGIAGLRAIEAAGFDVLGGDCRPGRPRRAVETARIALRGRP